MIPEVTKPALISYLEKYEPMEIVGTTCDGGGCLLSIYFWKELDIVPWVDSQAIEIRSHGEMRRETTDFEKAVVEGFDELDDDFTDIYAVQALEMVRAIA